MHASEFSSAARRSHQARVLSNTQQEHDLMHYKEDWHVNLVWDIYKESVYKDYQQIFGKASTKILDVC